MAALVDLAVHRRPRYNAATMDDDLETLSREQLLEQVRKLRAGIREHRDSTGHELCWHHPALWNLLPERTDPLPVVPAWPQFMQGCIRYRQSLDEQLPQAQRSDAPYAADIALDHFIVPARDRATAAERLAGILGVDWAAQANIGPFSAVYVSDSLTLDFDQADGAFAPQHYAFRVDEGRFDAILGRLRSLDIPFRGHPYGPFDGQVSTWNGGRVVYWGDPEGHVWEALTASYARA